MSLPLAMHSSGVLIGCNRRQARRRSLVLQVAMALRKAMPWKGARRRSTSRKHDCRSRPRLGAPRAPPVRDRSGRSPSIGQNGAWRRRVPAKGRRPRPLDVRLRSTPRPRWEAERATGLTVTCPTCDNDPLRPTARHRSAQGPGQSWPRNRSNYAKRGGDAGVVQRQNISFPS